MAAHARAKSVVCSFCGQTGTTNSRHVGLLGARICSDCVSRLGETVETNDKVSKSGASKSSRPPAKAAATLAAGTGTPAETLSLDEMLSTLPAISSNADQVLGYLQEWVQIARDRGATWGDIGGALGTSRQAAWERFNRGKPSKLV